MDLKVENEQCKIFYNLISTVILINIQYLFVPSFLSIVLVYSWLTMVNEIIFTGFGVFAGQEITNSSKEAVFKLPDHLEFGGRKFSVKKIEVPVTYDAADDVVKKIWSNKPALVFSMFLKFRIKIKIKNF